MQHGRCSKGTAFFQIYVFQWQFSKTSRFQIYQYGFDPATDITWAMQNQSIMNRSLDNFVPYKTKQCTIFFVRIWMYMYIAGRMKYTYVMAPRHCT